MSLNYGEIPMKTIVVLALQIILDMQSIHLISGLTRKTKIQIEIEAQSLLLFIPGTSSLSKLNWTAVHSYLIRCPLFKSVLSARGFYVNSLMRQGPLEANLRPKWSL